MITNIKKNVEKNILTVEVTCAERKFLSHEIKLLTTESIIDILKNQYSIVKVINEPNHKVGNTRRRRIKPTGVWVFELKRKYKTKKTTSYKN